MRGQVGRLADGGVVHAQIAADRADNHFAGVEPYPDLDRNTLHTAHAFRVVLHRLLHAQRRVAGPDRMILVGQGRAEQRHDAVAHHLIDGSLVAVNRIHHVRQNRIEQLPCLLGIAVGKQLHRALQVGEEYRDLLALAFDGGA